MIPPVVCRLLPQEPTTSLEYKPGDMWFSDVYWDLVKENVDCSGMLTARYVKEFSKIRAPIMVVCPGGFCWCVDAPATNNPNGWTVTGEAPKITVRASILTQNYHGYLTDGVFHDC